MSISTTKLDYARIRNAQRKNNKSIQGLKDSTNTQNSGTIQDTQTQPVKALPMNRDIENSDSKGIGSQGSTEFLNMFGSNFYAGNLEYINSLISNNNKSPSPISKREHSNQKSHSHKRAKSSLTESSQKTKLKYHAHNDENAEPDDIQTTPNMKLGPKFSNRIDHGLTLKYDTGDNIRIGIMNSDKEIDYRANMNPNNTPSIKEGRLFDQFFRKGALERRSMSLEDLRLKEVINEEKNTERGMEDMNDSCIEKSSEKNSIGKMELTARGDFLSNLNNYIHYFNKSEGGSKKNRNGEMKKYFVDQEKGSSYLKKELETARNESKLMRKQMEMIQNKMLEVVKANKRLMKDMNDMKMKEAAYHERIGQMEEQVGQVNQRKNHYKGKLLQMQELLELERIDNENNLVVLKRVLASNFNPGMDNRTMAYASNSREKPLSDKDYLRGALKDLLQQKKDRTPLGGGSMMKEKKPTSGSMFHNNRYDLQFNKKPKSNKDAKKYNLSLLSQKIDLDNEVHQYSSENNNQSDSSIPYGDVDSSYQPDIHTSEMFEKRVAKDHQIKYLQDKLMELMEGQESSPYLYEKTSSQKSLKKNKHKASESSLQNYNTLRERKGSYLKLNPAPAKSEFHLKKMKSHHAENSPPTNEMENLCSSTNRSD